MDKKHNDDLPSLEELDKSIKEFKKASKASKKDEETVESAVSPGRVVSDLVAGVIVGGAIGYYLDEFFSTTPIFFFIFLIIGVAGGILNIYKQATKKS